MSNAKKDLLTSLRSLLNYHASTGLGHYPRIDAIKSFLRFLPEVDGNLKIEQKKPLAHGHPVSQKKAPPIKNPPVKIQDIATEVASCHACELHKQRIYPVAGSGLESIRLLIVGDWLCADEKGELPPGHLFGVMQDQMLSRMLLAINVSADDVFISNVIKCAVPAACQPQATHVQSCVSFLRRQIIALRPELICTMGMVAARAVLEKSQPLSRLRGQFHAYEVEKGKTVPVIATYHPTYLLQNPEMKQATWADLQLLAKRLG
ncbi:MAG: uracil-DNA glycosylase [Desulforhopalus sp.]